MIIQAHVNLGLPEPKPWGTGEFWNEGDWERYNAELERIASDPGEVAAAVERFDEEVQRREQVEAENNPESWRYVVKQRSTGPLERE